MNAETNSFSGLGWWSWWSDWCLCGSVSGYCCLAGPRSWSRGKGSKGFLGGEDDGFGGLKGYVEDYVAVGNDFDNF